MKAKDRLLNITAHLTCGVVNGRKMRIRPIIKPPWAEKRLERDSECSSEDNAEQSSSVRNQQGWPHFKDVFMLSSVDSEDVETLKVRPS